MGMSASQAQYLQKIARMTNLEYEGQQINQQRLAYSNQMADNTAIMMGMKVPAPPSVNECTKTVISGAIASSRFTLEDIRPNGDFYDVNLCFSEHGNYLYSEGTAQINRDGDAFTVGTGETVYDLYNYRQIMEDPQYAGRISAANDAGYRDAWHNYWPSEFTDDMSEEEYWDKMCVYFTRAAGSEIETVHFIRASELPAENIETSWGDVYEYQANGEYPAYHNYPTAQITWDASGRPISISLPTTGDQYITYQLSVESKFDQQEYDDKMNQYYYEKAVYDKEIDDLNAKNERIQANDKKLELQLTNMDMERKALSNEIEALKKVVDENVERGFKTFSG